MKVDTLINPELEGIKEELCPYSLESYDIIDILYSISDILSIMP